MFTLIFTANDVASYIFSFGAPLIDEIDWISSGWKERIEPVVIKSVPVRFGELCWSILDEKVGLGRLLSINTFVIIPQFSLASPETIQDPNTQSKDRDIA